MTWLWLPPGDLTSASSQREPWPWLVLPCCLKPPATGCGLLFLKARKSATGVTVYQSEGECMSAARARVLEHHVVPLRTELEPLGL